MTEHAKHLHDFRNQLGIILGFSDLLLADTADVDPRHADLSEIHKAAERALALLTHLFPTPADAPSSPPGAGYSGRVP